MAGPPQLGIWGFGPGLQVSRQVHAEPFTLRPTDLDPFGLGENIVERIMLWKHRTLAIKKIVSLTVRIRSRNLVQNALKIKSKKVGSNGLLTADTRRLTQTKIYSPQRRRGRREIRAINRRFTQISADEDSEISPQRHRERRVRIQAFCLSGEDDKQKHVSIADDNRIQILMQMKRDNFSASLAENMPAGHEK